MNAEARTSVLTDYLHDRLGLEQRREVEDLLKRDADARAEYGLLSHARDTLIVPAPQLASDHGFEALMALIRQQGGSGKVTAAAAPVPPAQRRSPGSGRWTDAFGWLFRPSLSYAVAASIFVFQFAVLAVIYERSPRDEGLSELRTQPTVPPVSGPFIRASLKPDAKEADIRFLLLSLGATIVGGPTSLGDYFIYVPPERTDAVAQQMRQSPIADQVTVIATLPPLKD